MWTLQHHVTTRSDRSARREQVRLDRIEAVTALAVAVSAHRRALWMRNASRIEGAPADRLQDLREESHLTRAAVSRPLVALRVILPDSTVRAAADRMITTTYAMRHIDSSAEELTCAREAAVRAHDVFVDVAAAYLTPET